MYDPKINRSKGVEAGTVAGLASVLTSMLYVAIDHLWPVLSDNEVSTLATGFGILICAGIAAIWKMETNKAKHSK